MTSLYKSKIDFYVLLIKSVPFFILIAAFMYWQSFIIVAPLVVPCVFTLVQLLRTYYKITSENSLIVVTGFQRKKINIQEITSITKNVGFSLNDWFSNCSLSFDNSTLEHGNGQRIIVSPREQEKLILDIKSRNTNLK